MNQLEEDKVRSFNGRRIETGKNVLGRWGRIEANQEGNQTCVKRGSEGRMWIKSHVQFLLLCLSSHSLQELFLPSTFIKDDSFHWGSGDKCCRILHVDRLDRRTWGDAGLPSSSLSFLRGQRNAFSNNRGSKVHISFGRESQFFDLNFVFNAKWSSRPGKSCHRLVLRPPPTR